MKSFIIMELVCGFQNCAGTFTVRNSQMHTSEIELNLMFLALANSDMPFLNNSNLMGVKNSKFQSA